MASNFINNQSPYGYYKRKVEDKQQGQQSQRSLLTSSGTAPQDGQSNYMQDSQPRASLSTAVPQNNGQTQGRASLLDTPMTKEEPVGLNEETANAQTSSFQKQLSDWEADALYRTQVLGQTWNNAGYWQDKNGQAVANQNQNNNFYYAQAGRNVNQDINNRIAAGQVQNPGVADPNAFVDSQGRVQYRTDILTNRGNLTGDASDTSIALSGNTNNITQEQYNNAQSANTLWNYFQALGTTMPSWQLRANLYQELTGQPASGYTGDADQNDLLLRALQRRNMQLSGDYGQGKKRCGKKSKKAGQGISRKEIAKMVKEELAKSQQKMSKPTAKAQKKTKKQAPKKKSGTGRKCHTNARLQPKKSIR